jgi:twitching motility protein PilT
MDDAQEKKLFENFIFLLQEAIKWGITDIHISSEDFPFVRTPSRHIEPLPYFGKLTYEHVIALIHYMDNSVTEDIISSRVWWVNFVYAFEWSRFRANISKNTNGIAIAMRTIKKNIPTAESVWLDKNILKLLDKDCGLILVTGWTWSGKTTTVIAMLDYLNKNSQKHIITVEDPVEYLMKNEKSLIHQKQVGKHVPSFDQAIRDAMREDPDVIMVGEMRDQETISAVLTLAETGHLVISTLHTNDMVQTFDRLIYAFPGNMQSQIRIQLAMVVVAIIGQIILPHKNWTGNVVARELFVNTDAAKNIIMDGNLSHLYSVIETGKQEWQIMMQNALIGLHRKDMISNQVLLQHIKDPVILRDYIEQLRK